jgi:oxygen-independent coproporphyrinogen-3 oxidase
LEKIFNILAASFEPHPQIEITLEANPGTISKEYLRTIRQLGINRLSLGMQSANPFDLRLLERQHGLQDVEQAIFHARGAGFENVNLDLIFGLPNQTLDSWSGSLSMALSMQPDHLALYALTLEHGTPMEKWVKRGILETPDPDWAADMYELACEKLDRAGLVQYEISNWAQRNTDGTLKTCQHNLQYWRSLPYFGFGAGAHGYVNHIRTVCVLSPKAYIQRLNPISGSFTFPKTPATIEAHRVTRQEEMAEFMMMGLRLVNEGITQTIFEERFGCSLEETYSNEINRFVNLGLLEWKKPTLRLTARGRLLGNIVFQAFI